MDSFYSFIWLYIDFLFNDGETTGTICSKTFLISIYRHYKSLRRGFSLNRSDKYTVFCGRTKIQKVPLSFPPGTPAEGLQMDNMYLVLECLPLHSGYPSKFPQLMLNSLIHVSIHLLQILCVIEVSSLTWTNQPRGQLANGTCALEPLRVHHMYLNC